MRTGALRSSLLCRVVGPLDHPASACLLKGTNNSARLIGICLGVYAPGQRAPGIDCHSNIST